MSKLVKNSLIYALGELSPKIFSLITFPLLTSFLSPEEYGILNYINTIDIFLSIFCLLGLNTYFLVHYYKCETLHEKKALFGNLTIFLILFNVTFLCILLIFGDNLFAMFGSNISFYPYIAMGMILNFFNIQSVMPGALYRVQENPLPLTVVNILKGALTMIGTFICVICLDENKVESVLFLRIIVALIAFVIFMMMSYRFVIFNINLSQIINALKFSLPLLPCALAYYSFSLSDRFLIDKYLSLEKLGIYATAANLAMMLDLVSNSAYRAFEPHLLKEINSVTLTKEFIKIRNSLLWVVLTIASMITLLSKEFLTFFANEEYLLSYRLVPIILVGSVIHALDTMYSTIIIGKGKTKTETFITILCAIISITLNIILLPRVGIIGAAITFSITFMVMLFLKVKASGILVPQKKPVVSILYSFLLLISYTYYIDLSVSFSSIIIKTVFVIILCVVNYKILDVKLPFPKLKK